MISDGVLVAIVVTIGSIAGVIGTAISQTVLSRMAARQRHIDRVEDWERQDAVANKLIEQGKRDRDALKETTQILKEGHENIVAVQSETLEVVHETHILVNQKFTDLVEKLLTALVTQRALLLDSIAHKKRFGDSHVVQDAALVGVNVQIEALSAELVGLATAARAVEARRMKPELA